MADKIGQAPYYDNLDPKKEYTTLLFRPGTPLQNEELNEAQSILRNNIRQIGDTILTNGDIIEGCQLLTKDADDPEVLQKNCIISSGKLYLVCKRQRFYLAIRYSKLVF